ncbi:MAG TPA: hypothetical protein VFT47_02880 [Vicinamibacterales bacterium]|nr:hypothetical protein [Vicinamibacterales bacterium]
MRVLVVVLIMVSPLTAATTAAQQAENDAHNWAVSHQERVLEAALPIDAQLDVAGRDLKWGVRLRIMPAFEAESAYTLLMAYDGRVTASVTTLSGGSVLTQLKGLYLQHRNTSPGDLPALLKRSTHEFTGEQCPAVKRAAQSFERLRIPASVGSALQMDATGYQLVSEGRSGTLRLSINAPDPAPVIEWAERLRKSVAGCTAR